MRFFFKNDESFIFLLGNITVVYKSRSENRDAATGPYGFPQRARYMSCQYINNSAISLLGVLVRCSVVFDDVSFPLFCVKGRLLN